MRQCVGVLSGGEWISDDGITRAVHGERLGGDGGRNRDSGGAAGLSSWIILHRWRCHRVPSR